MTVFVIIDASKTQQTYLLCDALVREACTYFFVFFRRKDDKCTAKKKYEIQCIDFLRILSIFFIYDTSGSCEHPIFMESSSNHYLLNLFGACGFFLSFVGSLLDPFVTLSRSLFLPLVSLVIVPFKVRRSGESATSEKRCRWRPSNWTNACC